MKSENGVGQTQTISCDHFKSTAIIHFQVKMANLRSAQYFERRLRT